jgi:hypothetical protein
VESARAIPERALAITDRRNTDMTNNYTQATLTPDVRLTDELRAVLEITGASLEPAGDGEWYAFWEDGINELDDNQEWGIPQYPDAAEAAAFRDRWLGKDIADVLRAVLASNPGTGMLVIEGAYGCSKVRAGEFGGFGIYVTREQSAFISSQDVVMQDGQLTVTARVQECAAAVADGYEHHTAEDAESGVPDSGPRAQEG